MFNLIASLPHVAMLDGHYYGIGGFPRQGCVFEISQNEFKCIYTNIGKYTEQQLVNGNEILFVSFEGKALLGYIPIVDLEEGFHSENYFNSKVLSAIFRKSRREVVTLFIDEYGSYKVDKNINTYGCLQDIFYGDNFDDDEVVGIRKGSIVWRVSYEQPLDFRGSYPYYGYHRFYTIENNNLVCYAYDGGKFLFDCPLPETPSEVLEFDGRTVFQTSMNIISLDESGNVLGSINLPHDKNILYQGHHLLANDDNHIYVIDRETSDVVIYDYSLSERHRVSILKDFSVHFQRVSSELNALNLQCAKENIIGSSYMSFWHPDETLEIESFISDENNYSVERNESDGKSSYEVMIDTDNKHDFFRLCDVIVMDVANKYGEDYCEREEVDRQFGGDIRVLVNSKLFEMEPEWIATIQDRLNHMIKTLGGNMQGGVVSGDKQKYIEVTLIPKT